MESEKTNRCDRCSRNSSIIELKYLGQSLCENCFQNFFEKRVRKTIRTRELLETKDKIGVGVSGGKDSAATLYILKKFSDQVPPSKLVAITIDPGIEGHEKSLEAAEKIVKKTGVKHHVFSFEEYYGITVDEMVEKAEKEDEKRPPACSYCAVLRRKIMNEKARELKIDKLATGHNLDDEAQSAMMNFIRGDLNRIKRMGAFVGLVDDPRFVPRIKPMIRCPEEEMRIYSKIHELPFYEKKCPYSHESFRKTTGNVIDQLEENHPGSRFQILKSNEKIRERLCEEKKGEIGECKKCGEPTSGEKCKACSILEKFHNLQ